MEGADHVDALLKPGGADVLAGPGITGDVLVGRLSGPERGPEPAGEHRGQRRRRLRDDRRVVALTRGVHDAEGQRRRRQCGAEPGPGEPALALARAPRREV